MRPSLGTSAGRQLTQSPHIGRMDIIIPQREPFVDERGEIRNLVDAPFTSAAAITSVKGAI